MSDTRNIPTPAKVLREDYSPGREMMTLSDGYETSVYIHGETDAADLPVVYVHGIQSHPGWYYASAKAIADAGHRVYQSTRRGSGDNIKQRGHCDSPAQLFDDLDCVIDLAMQQCSCEKAVLLGVSWGGKLIADYYLSSPQRARRVGRLVMISPGLFSRIDVPMKTKLGVAANLLIHPEKKFDIPLGDVELFSDNPVMQEYLRSDEYQLSQATAKFMFTSRLLDKAIARAADKSIAEIFLMLAEDDKIIDNAATRAWVERVCASSEVTALPGEHTLEFTGDADVLGRYLAWLAKACKTVK